MAKQQSDEFQIALVDGRVRLSGRFDAAQCAKANEILDQITETTVVDCSGLLYISSAGIGCLFAVQKRLLPKQGELVLFHPDAHVLNVFELAGFDTIFKIIKAPSPAADRPE